MFKLNDENFKAPVISSNYRKKKKKLPFNLKISALWINTKQIFECYNSN